MGRRMMNARLSTEAYEAFAAYADDHGISVTALIEAIGLRLPDSEPLFVDPDRIIADARKIAADRRRHR